MVEDGSHRRGDGVLGIYSNSRESGLPQAQAAPYRANPETRQAAFRWAGIWMTPN